MRVCGKANGNTCVRESKRNTCVRESKRKSICVCVRESLEENLQLESPHKAQTGTCVMRLADSFVPRGIMGVKEGTPSNPSV